ncbi:aminotransferase class III-fold pyridoxal phosphate-dependent enzyme [Candidatus Babeliales bacterium]|nr:aminotransferase class III-fold pyridoxal phosphate-dependent enzyme [Candidatus Babeliales bacterium]
MLKRYSSSNKMLERALKSIPFGSQTFSKGRSHYPYGASPLFAQRGEGSSLWDVDGNEYIDFVSALAAILLGYNDKDVIQAVKNQLDEGTVFSLSHSIESEVAEKIIKLIPCAEMVRFGKNGSDATAAAVRLARAYTCRDHIITCGYHGWQDWYIGSTSRNLGVPKSTQKLTHSFIYNDIDSLQNVFSEFKNEVAAVIMEPMNSTYPKDGFLEAVKSLTHKNGAVFIFDEVITGFRYSLGGAQELFNVTPDLATFGKAMSNGYPISAVVGRADIMKLMEDIFYSFTFAGETISLAATLATLNKLEKQPVLSTVNKQGEKVIKGINVLIEDHGVSDVFSLSGHPSWTFLSINNLNSYSSFEVKTLLLQEMFKRGILTIGTHNMTFSHTDKDIECLLAAYNEVFPFIKNAIDNKLLNNFIEGEILKPLFKIR